MERLIPGNALPDGIHMGWGRLSSLGLSHSKMSCWVCQGCTYSLPGPCRGQLGPMSEFWIHQVWDGAQKCAFLTSPLVTGSFLPSLNPNKFPRLFVQKSYFENHFVNTISDEEWFSNLVVYPKTSKRHRGLDFLTWNRVWTLMFWPRYPRF